MMSATIVSCIIIAALSTLGGLLAARVRSRFRRDIRLVFKTGQTIVLPIDHLVQDKEVALKIDQVVANVMLNSSSRTMARAGTPSEHTIADFDWAAIQHKWSTLREGPPSKPDMPRSSGLSGSRRNLQSHVLDRTRGEDKENELLVAASGALRRTQRPGVPDNEEGELPDARKVHAPLPVLPDDATHNPHRRRATRPPSYVDRRKREQYA